MEIIAFSLDLARQKERPEFIRKQMDFLRRCGYNTILLYLEASVRTSVTPFFDPAASYSTEELAALADYGASVGLDVIPAFETLSHMEKFFVYDELADLSEFDCERTEGRDFCSPDYPRGSHGCATNPRLQAFTDRYVREVCGVFHSRYVHMGMDEMFQFACCDRCRRVLSGGKSKEQLFLEFVLHAHDLVSGMGRTMMIWDDMLEYYPVADRLPRDIVLCNWSYIYIGNSPRGKWTGRRGENAFALYDALGFRYLFSCKAGNLSQIYNVDSYTDYAMGYRPLGAVLTSWEHSDSFYPSLAPAIAYAGQKWSDPTDGRKAKDAYAALIGDADAAGRLADLCAPDFLFCRTDITRMAEENNHVMAAYLAQLRSTLDTFTRAESKIPEDCRDVFEDLYANLGLQYATLSVAMLGNRVFDAYEHGGVGDATAYLAVLDCAAALFARAEKTGDRLWETYRAGIAGYGGAWQKTCLGNRRLTEGLRADLAQVCGQKKGVLRVRLMLPDTYASIRAELSVRYTGDADDSLLFRGSTKTMMTMFDISGEYELRFATEPRAVESVTFSAYGEGEQYPVYITHFDGAAWHAPKSVMTVGGEVRDENNLLRCDASFATLGCGDGRAHLDDISLCRVRHSLRIGF